MSILRLLLIEIGNKFIFHTSKKYINKSVFNTKIKKESTEIKYK